MQSIKSFGKGSHSHFDQTCQQSKQNVHKKDFMAEFHKKSCHEWWGFVGYNWQVGLEFTYNKMDFF